MSDGRLLVIGKSGQVARCLAETEWMDVQCLGRPDIDLTKPRSIERALEAHGPDVVINTAAWTDVEGAETDPDGAYALNRDGAGSLALICAEKHVPLIHLSTDYVFDGTKAASYVETDRPNPINVYGASKRAGEVAVLNVHERATILRTSWVYSPFRPNFLTTMLDLGRSRSTISVVSDQVGYPTSAICLADGLVRIAGAVVRNSFREWPSIIHLAGPDACSWFTFAEQIFKTATPDLTERPTLSPVTTETFGAKARRPLNSQLDSSKAAGFFGVELPPLDQALHQTLEVLRSNN